MDKIEYSGLKIVGLYLEKLELLNEQERAVITKTIDLLNHPVFVAENITP